MAKKMRPEIAPELITPLRVLASTQGFGSPSAFLNHLVRRLVEDARAHTQVETIWWRDNDDLNEISGRESGKTISALNIIGGAQ